MRWAVGLCVVVALVGTAVPDVQAAEHSGRVTFGGVPVPGATVTASQGDRRITITTNEQGIYRFPELSDGRWTIQVQMVGFALERRDVSVAPTTPALDIPLRLSSLDEIKATVSTVQAERLTTTRLPTAVAAAPGRPAPAVDLGPVPLASRRPQVGPWTTTNALVIHGSTNNAAAARVAQAAAFGNNRNNRPPLHSGTVSAVFGNSAFDARPFSFAGQRPVRPSYSDIRFGVTFGGPVRLPYVTRSRADIFVGFGRNSDHQTSMQSSLVPSMRERAGDFSESHDALGRALTIVDPATGLPFSGNVIPAPRLSPQALALLTYYPHPNLDAGGRYNYQAPLVTATRQDSLEWRVTQGLDRRNTVTGKFSWQRARTDTASALGFVDQSNQQTLNAAAIWFRRLTPFFATRLRYQFTKTDLHVTPYFANRVNVSGAAGILGNDQDPANWGPPSLTFASGIVGLRTAQLADRDAIAHEWQGELLLNRPKHGVTVGALMRQRRVADFGQEDGRGTFGFTGDRSGFDLADFLLGLPHSSTIVFGNREKHLRAWDYEAFIADDWRVTPALTINLGVRWEFEAPMRELHGRLSNLDVTRDFGAAMVVTPSSAVGPVTGRRYPAGLLEPDYTGIQPRIGIAWRPGAKSSLTIRGSYGLYRNRATYQPLALLMAQQPPYATALSVESTAANPLTLAHGFVQAAAGAPSTFAVDPDFKVGGAHNWQLLVQRDLPGSLTVIASYLGAAGQHLIQEFLPNTYPPGAGHPCPTCPTGFVYVVSNGSSMRNAAQFELRRRLSGGFSASAQYTVARSTDDAAAFTGAALAGAAIAQDWTNLSAERGPSNFDHRHQLTVEVQYATAFEREALTNRTIRALVNDWTVTSQVTSASGLPLTPVFLRSIAGTGVIGSLRAALTDVSTSTPDGLYFNPAMYAVPAPGQWGNAGRNSVRGPSHFNMSAEIRRTFRLRNRTSLDWRIIATNVLNRVTYAEVNTTVGSPQFGAPVRANPMRRLQTSLRLAF